MFQFLFRSTVLGTGLAMDASAVSMANGCLDPKMKVRKVFLIAIIFGLFQGAMPLIGYFIGFAVLSYIKNFIPWIALILLCFLGGRMIFEALKGEKKVDINKGECENNCCEVSCKVGGAGREKLTFTNLFLQAIATSIDALSVGFTIADYTIPRALICGVIIAVVTFIISFVSVFLGKKFGTKLGKKAEILGGIILIFIGFEIFITGLVK